MAAAHAFDHHSAHSTAASLLSGPRASLRRLAFGLATLLGVRRLGIFIPYRHAASLRPIAYPALEAIFRDAEPRMRAFLDAIDAVAADLDAIAASSGPARFGQDWFPRLDAAVAYAALRQFRPARIVEIGSGHSTRFMARAIADGGLATVFTAIDPSPRATLGGLGVRHERQLLTDTDPSLFAALAPGDLLFVDSSHLALPGSDVDLVVNGILPRLAAGVIVHFHDILLPDPYPEAWTWRGYNEQSIVGALLQGGYDLLFSSHWLVSRRPEWVAGSVVSRWPLLPGAHETSLWLRKL